MKDLIKIPTTIVPYAEVNEALDEPIKYKKAYDDRPSDLLTLKGSILGGSTRHVGKDFRRQRFELILKDSENVFIIFMGC
ncbi:MAG: hypothetical protein EZS28_027294 [Streblomastix strix]|uniref:Uncharacterized protein n=1 Tax=Streblomastix strix TaxID=222440 RepID=A0A5J4V387_9EUKA|nr:MAG: hypothetical protein EZS28_027294 [Streblomastix strix]